MGKMQKKFKESKFNEIFPQEKANYLPWGFFWACNVYSLANIEDVF